MLTRLSKFLILVFLFLVTSLLSVQALEFGEYSLKYLEQISRTQRVAFTEGELYTGDYLGRVLRDLGYDTYFEEISFPQNSSIEYNQGYYLSHNIIAEKKGKSDLEVIIGTSYDSRLVSGSKGFERATGVSLILELATLLKDESLPYTVKFILFGGGIEGSLGATHYVSTRSQEDLDKIMYYLNVTSIGSGKEIYISGNTGNKGFLTKELMDLSKKLDININLTKENTTLNIPEGAAFDLGDNVPFKYSNVPFSTIYATSFESVDDHYGIPNDPTGDGSGLIEGTLNDTYEYVMDNYKDNVERNLRDVSELIYNYLMRDEKSIKVITSLSEENLDKVNLIKYELKKDGKKISEYSLDESMILNISNLDSGDYTLKVTYPKDIKFIKDISEFDFKFEDGENGEFVFLNDEINTYTYREGFTDNYNTLRQEVKDGEFLVKQKKFLFEYSANGDYSEEDELKNDIIIRNLSIALGVLILLYIILKLIFHSINKKRE